MDAYFTDRFGIKWAHSFYDEWGIKWYRPKSSHYYDMVYQKLNSVDYNGLDNYSWPDPNAYGRNHGLKNYVEKLYKKT